MPASHSSEPWSLKGMKNYVNPKGNTNLLSRYCFFPYSSNICFYLISKDNEWYFTALRAAIWTRQFPHICALDQVVSILYFRLFGPSWLLNQVTRRVYQLPDKELRTWEQVRFEENQIKTTNNFHTGFAWHYQMHHFCGFHSRAIFDNTYVLSIR